MTKKRRDHLKPGHKLTGGFVVTKRVKKESSALL